ncbi:hypothetical protein [Kutzneria buriramensis]|uniref:Beta/gamma crystallin n=1 Tax=Kutzneria buriramensis TaxID=1045776 RepID=A0A3E0HI49_9PSEU|nr:hypothetical protein [Kutzneria buriramensis]REH46164.1 hypothetical protein BCF44_107297 [Kutzneria buriramensis]
MFAVGRMSARVGVAASLGVVMVTAGVFSASASAGTNGQQIEVCSGFSNVAHVVVSGTNQSGSFTSEWLDASGGWCVTTWGWWFKNEVYASFLDAGYNQIAHWDCGWVPTSSNNDVYGCFRSQS